ncbi:MAG: polysaccharide deacetylase family protein [Proteobacteria bacterium]|nr:polysaccharide deacetylase family protein [Pseudomonadota bacterium]
MTYPRDLVGYAGRPPDPRWPDNARIAVSVVLNYEEGGEYNTLHGDPHSEYVLTDVGGEPLANARNLNVESNFEYGSRVGFWEIMRILRHRRVPATVYAVGMALERNAAAAAELAGSGFEVACHGQRWIDYQFVPEEVERADIARNVEVITRLIGRRPVGWYTGRPSPNTRRLAMQQGGFLYESDAYNDDLPYWTAVGSGQQLIIPHSFDCNDSRLQRGGDFVTGEDFFRYCADAFNWLYRRGGEGSPRMMSVSLHGRIIGRPGRIGALERLLDHIQRHDAVWMCDRQSIARHWRAVHPAAATPHAAALAPGAAGLAPGEAGLARDAAGPTSQSVAGAASPSVPGAK